jgi:hypothetical protein
MRTPDYLLIGNFLLEKKDQKPLDKDIDWLKEFDWIENMNIRQDIKELKTGDRDLRKFGLLVGECSRFGNLISASAQTDLPLVPHPGFVLMTFGAVVFRAPTHLHGMVSLAIVIGCRLERFIDSILLVITPIGL